ncbi:CHAT domain-containing protein [Candidatus Eisenbacteria bacterium]|uniref:CHAT domain-containing protein n=1 Tax=Eiseniibacteriota bacterium TaxID=2212470 RepID=A0ABV6YKI5_UNCEI
MAGESPIRRAVATTDANLRAASGEIRRSVQARIHAQDRSNVAGLRKRCQRLFELLAPSMIGAAISGSRDGTLIVGKDDLNTLVPWELLHDGEDYLAYRHVIAHRTQTGRPRSGVPDVPRKDLLVIVDPTVSLKQVRLECAGFHHVIDELPRGVRPSRNIMKGRLAGPAWVRRCFADYEVAHFSGHCDSIPEKDGQAGLRFGSGIHLRLDDLPRPFPQLIFLHACGSDMSITEWDPVIARTAEIAMAGGARVFIAVSSLLPDLPSLAVIIENFYRSLFNGVTVGEALLEARRETRRTGKRSAVRDLLGCLHEIYGDPDWRFAELHGDRNNTNRATSTLASPGCQVETCTREVPPEYTNDPFNAFCPRHRLSIPDKRQEARSRKLEGQIRSLMFTREVKEAQSRYMHRISQRFAFLKDWLDIGPPHEGLRFRVLSTEGRSAQGPSQPVFWNPIRHASNVRTHLKVLGDRSRKVDGFPEENRAILRVEIAESRGRPLSKRRMFNCLVIALPDRPALLRDDFVWRPISFDQLRTTAQNLYRQRALGIDNPEMTRGQQPWVPDAAIWAWVTPLGAGEETEARIQCPARDLYLDAPDDTWHPRRLDSEGGRPTPPGLHLVVRLHEANNLHPDHPTRCSELPVMEDRWLKAAAAVFRGLLDPRDDDVLRAAIRKEVATRDYVALEDIADRFDASSWLVSLIATDLAGSKQATVTILKKQGVRYICRPDLE